MEIGVSKPVVCVETGEIFISPSSAEREKGVNRGSISECCRGLKCRHTAGGFHWRYADPKEVKNIGYCKSSLERRTGADPCS